MVDFNLTKKERNELYELVINRLENYYDKTRDYAVAPSLDVTEIRELIANYGFKKDTSPSHTLHYVIDALEKYMIHTSHPRYLGLFNPRVNFAGILADLITAVFNPQLASWSQAPFPVEVESYLVQEFGKKFGFDPECIDGVFATGGAEANLTAVLCALNNKYPNFAKEGIFSINKRPIIYCSDEVHHSIAKAVKIAGLGYQVINHIPVDDKQSMRTVELENQIQKDIALGHQPLMIVATAGTTGTGAIDDLVTISKIAKKYQLWFHTDGAYGGAAILNNNLKATLDGIESSDSIIIDAHKWLALPMGISLFLTSHKDILNKTFRVTADYMPREANELEVTNLFSHSIQWSRRFIGLKLYLSLLFFGWEGYDQVIEHQRQLGVFLKAQLIASNWQLKNNTPFPIACFTDDTISSNKEFTTFVCDEVIKSGESWMSQYPINGLHTLRLSITNYASTKEDVEALVEQVNQARKKYLTLA